MKKKYLILLLLFLMSCQIFAQKDTFKPVEKALNKGKTTEALAILDDLASKLSSMPETEKAKYFFIKGKAHLTLIEKGEDIDKNLLLASKAYQSVLSIEKAIDKVKYTLPVLTSIPEIKRKLIERALADSKTEKYGDGADKLYEAYQIDTKDTINLYYAASTYINAKKYDTALKLYQELKRIGYTGKGTNYYAVNKSNGEEQLFANAEDRDGMVKSGTYEKPRTEKVPSKRSEIYKNMALILVQNGKVTEAKNAVAEARIMNPSDKSLIITEANLYLETKDFETYKRLIAEALKNSPNDVDLIFNLGVVHYNLSEEAEAEKYYLKAIAINPNYVDAYLNLAALKLDADKKIIREMQKLGNSENENKRYAELKEQREDIFKSALPYLEKAYALAPSNSEVKKILLSVYRALEMTDKAKILKDQVEK